MVDHVIDLVEMALFSGVYGISVSVVIAAVFVLLSPISRLVLVKIQALETFFVSHDKLLICMEYGLEAVLRYCLDAYTELGSHAT
jgi:hypothetical protein